MTDRNIAEEVLHELRQTVLDRQAETGPTTILGMIAARGAETPTTIGTLCVLLERPQDDIQHVAEMLATEGLVSITTLRDTVFVKGFVPESK